MEMPNMFGGGIPQGLDPKSEEWREYIGHLQLFLKESSGLQRKQIEAQISNAKEGLKNQMAIARLQSETSRYGVDAQRETALAQLQENQRQFDLTHGLEMQKFGLNYAMAETEFLSSPDRYAQGADFRAAASRILGPGTGPGAAAASGPRPYGADTDFQAKTPADFAVLAGKYNGGAAPPGGAPAGGVSPNTAPTPYQVSAATTAPPTTSAPPAPVAAAPASSSPQPYGASTANSPTPGATAQTASTGAAQPPDPRVQVLTSMFKAMPPSREEGLDANDFAVMQAAQALMSTNLRPGSLERLRPDQQKIFGSYVRRSGRSLPDFLADYKAYGVHQGDPRRA